MNDCTNRSHGSVRRGRPNTDCVNDNASKSDHAQHDRPLRPTTKIREELTGKLAKILSQDQMEEFKKATVLQPRRRSRGN